MHRNAIRLALLFFSVLLGIASVAAQSQDTLRLKSGRSLIGRLVEARVDAFVFDDDELGELVVDRRVVRAVGDADAPPSLYDETAPAPAADAKLPPRDYVRYEAPRRGEPGRLSTGVSRWHHAETDTTLFLVGAVHIGEREYFTRLQQILDATDVVLFEGVGRGAAADAPPPEELAKLDALMQVQLQLKDVLGLAFQKDGMDYRRSFWRNADADYPSMRREMDRRGVSLPTDNAMVRGLLKLVLGSLDVATAGEDNRTRMRLRRQFASVLGSPALLRGGMMRGAMSVILDWRNEVAIEFLDRELDAGPDGRWLSLFYGAAHLPDFERRLEGRGFTCVGADWLEAWIVR